MTMTSFAISIMACVEDAIL